MARRQLLALIFVSGYIVALVPVLWARYDIARIPRSIWRYTAPRPRELWRGGLFVAYACAGWPGLVAALLWRFSGDRRALREEWEHLHRRNVDARREPESETPAPVVLPSAASEEPEIVLADYEDAETAVRAADVDEPQVPARGDAPGAQLARGPADRDPARDYCAAVRRVVCSEYGPPSLLTIVEEPDPVPGPGQVVVAVDSAGVNYVDVLLVAGTYQIKIPPPFTPGTELAGTVAAIGDGVDGWSVGDRVLATTFGAFASHVTVPAALLSRVPDALELDVAAALVQSYTTMWFALTRRTTIAPGQTVLVLGAGGGIGLASIDVATALGATVIAAASSAEKLDAARAAGASEVIDYTTEDLKTQAKALSGGGVDVVVDPVGGDHAEAALRATGWNGRFLVLGFAGGSIPKLPANLVLLNNRTLIGVDWGAWTGREPSGQQAVLDEVLAAVADGRLTPPQPHRVPLDDTATVLQDALDRRLVGKTVLNP